MIRLHDEALTLLERENPDSVVIFRGDCLVDQAPFAWLNEKHNGEPGMVWIDWQAGIENRLPKVTFLTHQ
ncbi:MULTISPECIES: hypothetical protein [unclassified Erwinia]|uniref:hypothetical protein n=1 Tax=unclassified Erwinia TaxID=2622719 RepID=UPI000B08DCDB|nr:MULTISPECIES: hypothetical protein [unclassified Erwinia]